MDLGRIAQQHTGYEVEEYTILMSNAGHNTSHTEALLW